MFSVYVGRYETVRDSHIDQKKLNNLGVKCYLFSMGDYFSLKTFSHTNEDLLKNCVKTLEKHNFKDVYIK